MVLPPIFMPSKKKYKIYYDGHDFHAYSDRYRCSNYSSNKTIPCNSTIKLYFIDGKAEMENMHQQQCEPKVLMKKFYQKISFTQNDVPSFFCIFASKFLLISHKKSSR